MRWLLATMTLVALVIVFWQRLAVLTFGMFWPLLLVMAIGSFATGCRFGCSRLQGSHRSLGSVVLFLLLVSGLAVSFLSLVVRYRWLTIFHAESLPSSWAYVDHSLMALHSWFDARYPAPPDSLKIRGEFYRVLLTLNLAALACTAGASLLLGIMSRTITPVEWSVTQARRGIQTAKVRLLRHDCFRAKLP